MERLPAASRVPGPDVFRSVCVSSQPALGVGFPPGRGSRPRAGLVPWGEAAAGGPCPRPSGERGWQGGQIFNVLYRVFLCNHPHFYLMTDLSWLLFLNSALVGNKRSGPGPAWGVVCDASSELCAPSGRGVRGGRPHRGTPWAKEAASSVPEGGREAASTPAHDLVTHSGSRLGASSLCAGPGDENRNDCSVGQGLRGLLQGAVCRCAKEGNTFFCHERALLADFGNRVHWEVLRLVKPRH